jgi:hypothetical protein
MKNMCGRWNTLKKYSVYSNSAFDCPWAAAVFHRGPQQNKVDWEKFVTITSHNIARNSWLLSVTQNTFVLGIIYLEATYCNSRTLVPQDVLSLNKYTIYFRRLMYSPVLYSYLMWNVRFLTSVACWQVNFTVLNTNHGRTSEELDKLLEYIFWVMWNGFLNNIWIALRHEIWECTTRHCAST